VYYSILSAICQSLLVVIYQIFHKCDYLNSRDEIICFEEFLNEQALNKAGFDVLVGYDACDHFAFLNICHCVALRVVVCHTSIILLLSSKCKAVL